MQEDTKHNDAIAHLPLKVKWAPFPWFHKNYSQWKCFILLTLKCIVFLACFTLYWCLKFSHEFVLRLLQKDDLRPDAIFGESPFTVYIAFNQNSIVIESWMLWWNAVFTFDCICFTVKLCTKQCLDMLRVSNNRPLSCLTFYNCECQSVTKIHSCLID